MYPCEYKAKKIAFAYFTSGRFFFFFLWSSSSTGVSGETNGDIDSLAADEISCDSNAALFEMWEENQIEQQSSLRAAAAATPSDTGVLHSESLCSILRALISFHEISCTAERDVSGAQKTHGRRFSSFQEAEKKGVDVKRAQLAIWVLTEETVFNQTHQEFFVLASSHPDGLYSSSTLCIAITNPWITIVSATSNIWGL